MRRAAIVWFGHETIARLLRLPEGQRVVGLHADWLRLGVGAVIQGDDLPEVPDDEMPGLIQPDGYVDFELRPKLEALLQRYYDERDGMDPADVLNVVRRVLAGEYDPRIEMPEELHPQV